MASQIIADGIWTWFNHPEAVYHAASDSIIWGAIDAAGRPFVYQYHLTDNVLKQVLLRASFEVDDHNNPAVLVLASGKILCCYSRHDGASYSRTSKLVGDIAGGFETEVALGTTVASYAQLAQVADNNDTIYWFWRETDGVGKTWWFRTSTDDGANWSGGTQLLSIAALVNQNYIRIHQASGTRIDVYHNNALPPGDGVSLYHFAIIIDATDGSREYQETDGTVIGDDTDLPLDPAVLTLVEDGTSDSTWVWKGYTYGGNPACAYVRFMDADADDIRYRQARWSGSAWVSEEIATGGDTADDKLLALSGYAGGFALDPNDADTVYISRKYDTFDTRIEKYEHSGTFGSGSWSKTEDISGDTNTYNCRPLAVDCNGTTRILYWNASTYSAFTTYSAAVMIHPSVTLRAGKEATPAWNTDYDPVGVIGYYLFHEGTGSPTDLTPNSYDGTNVGSPAWGAGVTVHHPLLGGFSTSDYVLLDSGIGTAWEAGAYPKWFAVKFTNANSTTDGCLLGMGNSADADTLIALRLNAGGTANQIQAFARDLTGGASQKSVSAVRASSSDGGYHTLMLVLHTADLLELFYDGVSEGTTSLNNALGTLSVSFTTIGVLRRTTVTLPCPGSVSVAALGVNGFPGPMYLHRDWMQGQYAGTFGTSPPPPPATSGGRLLLLGCG